MSGEHETSIARYALILLALLVLTGLTVVLAYIPLDPFNLTVAMLVAVAKGTLVLLYFMHMRGGDRINWVVIATGLILLSILVGMVISDALTRGWVGGV